MSDLAPEMTAQEMAELAALADGTLPPERRAAVEARVAASPELQELLERQRQTVLAVEVLAADEVPASLRADVESLATRRARRRPMLPRLVLAGAAAAAAVVAAVVLSSGPGAPTVADAARLATKPPTAAAPLPAGTTRLAIGVEGVAFPNLTQYGWRALGVRRGRVDGRDATVVVYGKDGRRLGYVIVAGPGLGRPEKARAQYIRKVAYQILSVNGRLAVTWRRGGHTCVLIGGASRGELLKLASWPLSPR